MFIGEECMASQRNNCEGGYTLPHKNYQRTPPPHSRAVLSHNITDIFSNEKTYHFYLSPPSDDQSIERHNFCGLVT